MNDKYLTAELAPAAATLAGRRRAWPLAGLARPARWSASTFPRTRCRAGPAAGRAGSAARTGRPAAGHDLAGRRRWSCSRR